MFFKIWKIHCSFSKDSLWLEPNSDEATLHDWSHGELIQEVETEELAVSGFKFKYNKILKYIRMVFWCGQSLCDLCWWMKPKNITTPPFFWKWSKTALCIWNLQHLLSVLGLLRLNVLLSIFLPRTNVYIVKESHIIGSIFPRSDLQCVKTGQRVSISASTSPSITEASLAF